MKQQFQNKVLSLLILLSLFSPLFSNAWIPVPEATLTITVNTQVEDALFNINIENNYDGWQLSEQIQVLSACKEICL